jgi:hypothetical protein
MSFQVRISNGSQGIMAFPDTIIQTLRSRSQPTGNQIAIHHHRPFLVEARVGFLVEATVWTLTVKLSKEAPSYFMTYRSNTQFKQFQKNRRNLQVRLINRTKILKSQCSKTGQSQLI